MARIFEDKIEPAVPARTVRQCVGRVCDLCGAEAERGHRWDADSYVVEETEVAVTIKRCPPPYNADGEACRGGLAFAPPGSFAGFSAGFFRPDAPVETAMPRDPDPAPEPVVPLFAYVDPRDLDIRDPEVFVALVAACRREARVRVWPMVAALLTARWRFELPGGPDADPEPMSWYWRRPPRRRGSQGQLYRSTGQAYGALLRQTPRG